MNLSHLRRRVEVGVSGVQFHYQWSLHAPRYPLGKCFGEYFSQNVRGFIHIRIDLRAIFRHVQATFHSPAGKHWLVIPWDRSVSWNEIVVQRAGLRCIAFFVDDDLNSRHLRLVLNHPNQQRVRQEYEILVVH